MAAHVLLRQTLSGSSSSSTGSICSLDSEIFSAESEREKDGMCYADSARVPEEASIIYGPRWRATVDYRKLYCVNISAKCS